MIVRIRCTFLRVTVRPSVRLSLYLNRQKKNYFEFKSKETAVSCSALVAGDEQPYRPRGKSTKELVH